MGQKVRHSIYCKHKPGCMIKLDISTIRKAASAALREEGVDMPCEIGVLITDDAGIRALNRAHRGLDEPTDVLSFPQQRLSPGSFTPSEMDITANNGVIPLGDIVISSARVDAQAAELQHPLGRETAYLVIHSVLHLLGYDHEDPESKRLMRAREDEIITRI